MLKPGRSQEGMIFAPPHPPRASSRVYTRKPSMLLKSGECQCGEDFISHPKELGLHSGRTGGFQADEWNDQTCVLGHMPGVYRVEGRKREGS